MNYSKKSAPSWSPSIAYAVGLITTDGCLSSDKRHIEFSSKDKKLVETFRKCLSIQNEITKKQSGYTKKDNYFRVQFGNVVLYRWLLGIGLTPKKSKTLGELKIPNKFFFDFLRGHLDGDGSVKKYFDPIYPKSLRLYVVFISASLKHVLWLKKEIKNLTGKDGYLRETSRIHSLSFSKYNSIDLLNRIYYKNNLPLLKRKFLTAKEFLKMPR